MVIIYLHDSITVYRLLLDPPDNPIPVSVNISPIEQEAMTSVTRSNKLETMPDDAEVATIAEAVLVAVL